MIYLRIATFVLLVVSISLNIYCVHLNKGTRERLAESNRFLLAPAAKGDERTRAIQRLQRAIFDEGSMPSYHRGIMKKHRKEWPTLWSAIDELLK